jgi:hypothetical protein
LKIRFSPATQDTNPPTFTLIKIQCNTENHTGNAVSNDEYTNMYRRSTPSPTELSAATKMGTSRCHLLNERLTDTNNPRRPAKFFNHIHPCLSFLYCFHFCIALINELNSTPSPTELSVASEMGKEFKDLIYPVFKVSDFWGSVVFFNPACLLSLYCYHFYPALFRVECSY